MQRTYYKQITFQPHAYPYYSANGTFIAPKNTSPYNVADDLTRVYYRHPSMKNRRPRVYFGKLKTNQRQTYLQPPQSPCDGWRVPPLDFIPRHPFYEMW